MNELYNKSLLFFLICVTTSLPWECPSNSSLCLSGDKHKKYASPENEEYAACFDYAESSCCTANFTKQLSLSTVEYILDGENIFNWSSCGPMSKECERYFIEIECLYRCDPNMIYFAGLYPSSLNRVPICGQYCDHWFNACYDDLTCVTNWIFDWEYSDNSNQCPVDETCKTFKERYNTSENLCNILWGSTFNYTHETDLCLTPGYYKVNTLVVEDMFDEVCTNEDVFPSTSSSTHIESDTSNNNENDTLLIVGIICLVIGISLTIVGVICLKQSTGQSGFSVRQESTANVDDKHL